MILSGLEIKKRLGGDIVIDPFNDSQLNPNSYNLRLGNTLMMYVTPKKQKRLVLDARVQPETKTIHITKDGFVLQPNTLYLGETMEYTETNNLVPGLEGRSSVARMGLFVHITAGFGDIGFKGRWTLELHTIHPFRVYPGMEICQIFYHEIKGDYIPYQSKYQHSMGVISSRLYQDFNK